MAHTIPDQILDFDKASREDVIFNAMKNGLGDDYWVFHSLGVNQTSTNGVFYEKEIDFVVYHREKGILCVSRRRQRRIELLYFGLPSCRCEMPSLPMGFQFPHKELQNLGLL